MNLHTNLDLTAYGLVFGAVLWIFVVTATFSRLLSGLWAEFLELFCGFLQLQLLFSQFFRLLS
jgi:type III secretory pathway component EscU